MHTLTGGEDTGCPQRRSSKVLFNVRIEIIEKFRSTVGQCAFPRVAMWVWNLKVIERGSCKTAQRSTWNREELKSIFEAFGSTRIKEKAKKNQQTSATLLLFFVFPVWSKARLPAAGREIKLRSSPRTGESRESGGNRAYCGHRAVFWPSYRFYWIGLSPAWREYSFKTARKFVY